MRYTLAPRVGLFPGEIAVFTDVWHLREHLRESPAAGPLQCDPEDFAVLLLGAAIALGRALLQRPNELVRHVSDHQLRHVEPPRSEEHTSELQSRLHLVCRLLLEK